MNVRFGILLADVLTEKREWADTRALSARSGVPTPSHRHLSCGLGGVQYLRWSAGQHPTRKVCVLRGYSPIRSSPVDGLYRLTARGRFRLLCALNLP